MPTEDRPEPSEFKLKQQQFDIEQHKYHEEDDARYFEPYHDEPDYPFHSWYNDPPLDHHPDHHPYYDDNTVTATSTPYDQFGTSHYHYDNSGRIVHDDAEHDGG